jgi:cysteinyl-tRNA synthetase
MAKSTGNLVLVTDLLQRHSPAAVRFGLLHRSWQEPWDCEEEVFEQATADLAALRETAGDPSEVGARHDGVLQALADELDVPAAVALARTEGPAAVRYLLDLLKVRTA